MYSGEFDGATAFSGGGFMPSQATVNPNNSSSVSKNRIVRTLLPLTVKQLNEISSSIELTATIDGIDVSTVTIVGKVCDMQDKEPQFTFLIDDGTGKIECSRWAHERLEFNEVSQILQGMYVRVYGHLKSLQDKRTLNAYSLRPVIDFNEITSHFIECIYVHVYNTNLRAGIMAHPQMINSTAINTPLKEYQAVPSNQFSGHYSFDGDKSIYQIVLNFLRRPEFLAINNGIHCSEIAKQLNLPMDKLMEVLEYLNENSLVYSVDEFHYKSAVNA
ncbi:replication protein A 32 kDa subunit B [Mangifera indica]|uniref:replication protein A 32 kDa subunit B n=1 Tax=Mangifera indica TaxID=29780 RepID=UPI001CFBBF04|nr:replication protein A 32 kDa subunit B [Mangifera indica]